MQPSPAGEWRSAGVRGELFKTDYRNITGCIDLCGVIERNANHIAIMLWSFFGFSSASLEDHAPVRISDVCQRYSVADRRQFCHPTKNMCATSSTYWISVQKLVFLDAFDFSIRRDNV
ncbi:hypothetical protein BC936DRAFT_148757 [Jimgerdemannia flammicorona]|uniref:Uncharacterized protein n=1 Tax=Jimgerdemannia flammicorona TaxID=994334 RepID=A0A433D2B9_9FUNG|nr:hypothetical protein BC936DRAFT_148757 [Jimgerdemannia flammicorona]